MESAQIQIDAGSGVSFGEALIGEIQQIFAFDVCQFLHPALLTQKTPDMQMDSPKTADGIFHARFAPVALLHMLKTFQFIDQPPRQSFGIALRFIWPDLALDLAAPVRKKTAELEHGVATDICPLGAHLFGMDEIQPALKIEFQVELWIRLERQPQNMTGHRQINVSDHKRTGPTASQPLAILFQQNDIFRRPLSSWTRFGIIARQAMLFS